MIMKKKSLKKRLLPYALLLPSFIFFVAFVYYPFAKTIFTSFSVTTEIGEFVTWAGLSNWKRVFSSMQFWSTIKNTFIMAGICLTFELGIAMLFALMSAKEKKGSKIYQTLFSAPMVIASTAVAAMWSFMFRQDGGIINTIFHANWDLLKDKDSALIVVSLITSWGAIAGQFLWLMVGFRNVPDDLIEASVVDGAGWWTRTIKIMIPMASPQIFYVLFTSIISAFKTFTQIKLLTYGGPAGSTTTLMWQVYNNNQKGSPELACCWSLLLFIVIFLATRIQFVFEKKMVHYQ